MNKVSVYIHRLYYEGSVKKGGLDQIIDFVLKNGWEVTLYEFPLDYNQYRNINVSRITKDSVAKLYSFHTFSRRKYINWPLEILLSLFLTLRFSTAGSVVFTADPLTTFPVIFYRFLGFFRFHYYHAVDYSPDRFKNSLLNKIYTRFLQFGLRYSDLVGVVTNKAKDRLTSFREKPFIYVPNSPDFEAFEKYRQHLKERNPFSLVMTCAQVSGQFRVMEQLEMFKNLFEKDSRFRLSIVGYFDPTNEYCMSLQDFLVENNLDKFVTFYGNVAKEKNCEIISRCGIGLAFYDEINFKYVKFGDSLKIREYAVIGLPSVADTATPTAHEMVDEDGGFMVTSFEEAEEWIMRLVSDAPLYSKISENALAWAKKMDKQRVMQNLLNLINAKK